ncbi:MAG: gluconate:H+ symporter, GntP family [Chloroflexota bacterium]|jgi:GntP family gluconate:H+ symporter|nr:gluconate:H+ symporter, GntP family [Chloroflexota bacterium]
MTLVAAAAAASAWTAHDTRLILCAAAAVALVVLLVVRAGLHAFPALMVGSLLMGLAAGEAPNAVAASFESGVGAVLGNVGVVLALGTMLGRLLANSGGADRIAEVLVSRSGRRLAPWTMALIAMIIGIPLFFEIGVVLLIPVIFTVARRLEAAGPDPGGHDTHLLVGLPALAGLSVLHGLVPPHPGPLIAIAALRASLGTTLLYGLIVAVPTVLISGPLFALLASRWAVARPPQRLVEQVTRETRVENPPGFGVTLATILLPVALMLVRTVADLRLGATDPTRRWCDFIGEPIVALLIAVLVALYTFGIARGVDRRRLGTLLGDSLAPAASILLIIGSGGGFKQVLIDSGIGGALASAAQHTSVSLLLLAWLVAVLIRLATGSATVATVTAAGIIAPVVAASPSANRALVALAIGTGSLFLSHVNDAGFWLINQYFGMTVRDTFTTWSAMETLISVVGLVCVLGLGTVV